ncbi:hypothetical protein I4U23_020880 [Adineta vaga]|nr:hypothetical protein I4U23_020880 [Adineta vaga]
MYESEISEYTTQQKMEETTAKIYDRLHQMKKILFKAIQKTSSTIRSKSNCRLSLRKTHHNNKRTSSNNMTSDDTISSISGDSIDSGVSALSNFSHCSLSSSTLLFNQSMATSLPKSYHLRCDPSIINYISHNLLTTDRSELFLDETLSEYIPLAESSRRIGSDTNQTIIADDEDDQMGPLTSTMIDRWYSVTKTYTATFHQDLTIKKYELIQVLRSTHPHWIWVRNEQSDEGFIPTDCLMIS